MKNKKGKFTWVHALIIFGVVAILVGGSVGLYYGLSNSGKQQYTLKYYEDLKRELENYVTKTPNIETKSQDEIAYDFIVNHLVNNNVSVEKVNYSIIEDDSNKDSIFFLINDPKYAYFTYSDSKISEVSDFYDDPANLFNNLNIEGFNLESLRKNQMNAMTLSFADMNGDEKIKSNEIGKRVTRINLSYKDSKLQNDYIFVPVGSSPLATDLSNRNDDSSHLVSVSSADYIFTPYGKINESDNNFYFDNNLYPPISDFTPSRNNFLTPDDPLNGLSNPENANSKMKIQQQYFCLDTIDVNSILTNVEKATLFDFPCKVSDVPLSNKDGNTTYGEFFGNLDEVLTKVKEDTRNDSTHDIFVGKEMFIDKTVSLPQNCRIKVGWDIAANSGFDDASLRPETAELSEVVTPSHLTLKEGSELIINYKGDYKGYDTYGQLETINKIYPVQWDCGLRVTSRVICSQAYQPTAFQKDKNGQYNAGLVTINKNATITIKTGSSMKAHGIVEGEGLIHVEKDAHIWQQLAIQDFSENNYESMISFFAKKVFPFNKYEFMNIFCNLRLDHGALLNCFIWLYWGNNDRCMYFPFIGDTQMENHGGTSLFTTVKPLFGVTKDSDYILLSREDGDFGKLSNPYGYIDPITGASSGKEHSRFVIESHGILVDSLMEIPTNLITLTVKDLPFPLYNMAIKISSSANFQYVKYKYLPGSYLELQENSETTLKNSAIFYGKFDYCIDNNASKRNIDTTVNSAYIKLGKGFGNRTILNGNGGIQGVVYYSSSDGIPMDLKQSNERYFEFKEKNNFVEVDLFPLLYKSY